MNKIISRICIGQVVQPVLPGKRLSVTYYVGGDVSHTHLSLVLSLSNYTVHCVTEQACRLGI